jgi:hypothetical protein
VIDIPSAHKSFWRHPMVPLGDEAQLEVIQDRCAVCVKHTIGIEILLDTPMEFLGDVYHVESQFFCFRDSVIIGAR